jgi:transcriptional regulator with XRE-family HTH domain
MAVIVGTYSMDSLPRNLRDIMHERNITSTAFAKELGVTRMSVYNWRAGRTDPTLIRLFKIAEVLDTNIGRLLNSQRQIKEYNG